MFNKEFTGLVFIVSVEYLNLGSYVPLLNSLKVTLLAAVVLFSMIVLKNGLHEISGYKPVKLLYIFIFLTFLAMFHGLVSIYALEVLKQHIGYFFLAVIGFYALSQQRKGFDRFVVFFVAIHCILVFMNLDKFQMGERAGTFRAGYFLGDGNDFAWGLVIALPFSFYLMWDRRGKFVWRLIGIAVFLFIVLGIVGTKSRGGSIALAASLLYLWAMLSSRKILGFAVIALVFAGIIVFAPTDYAERMKTIAEYEQDSSAMGRITAWGYATQMAIDNPLLGVGAGSFNSAYGRDYRREGDPQRWISTHSIFFKVLAEYGFLGLVLFLYLIYSLWVLNRKLRAYIEENPSKTDLPYYAPELINMSLVGYASAGAFLTGVEYPHFYLLMAFSLGLNRLVHQQAEDRKNELSFASVDI